LERWPSSSIAVEASAMVDDQCSISASTRAPRLS
jgi:hypothetical protein